jgi:hypothetical protein
MSYSRIRAQIYDMYVLFTGSNPQIITFDSSKIHSDWLHFFSPSDLAFVQVLNHRLLTLFLTNPLRHITSMSRDIFEWDTRTNYRIMQLSVWMTHRISERYVIAPTVSLDPPRTFINHITLTTQIVPVPTHYSIYAMKFDIFLTAFSKCQYYIKIHYLRIYNNVRYNI